MTQTLYVDKTKVIAQLNARQLEDRARWVERELPELIDAGKNYALLHMLGIDLDATTLVEVVSPL